MKKEQEIELLETFKTWKSPNQIEFQTYNDSSLLRNDIWTCVQRDYLTYITKMNEPIVLDGGGSVYAFAPDIEFCYTDLGCDRLNQLKGIEKTVETEPKPEIKIKQWSLFGHQQASAHDGSWKQELPGGIWDSIWKFIKSFIGK